MIKGTHHTPETAAKMASAQKQYRYRVARALFAVNINQVLAAARALIAEHDRIAALSGEGPDGWVYDELIALADALRDAGVKPSRPRR